ncbi:MAG TPA: Do family serine endopeptidase [Devosiaceae bacterium]|nr:Do family serine endopeptidase [Devosiaceae bacterium]
MTRLAVLTLVILATLTLQPARAQDARVVPQSDAQVRLSYAPVVARAAPAVVNVYATRVEQVRQPLLSDPFFERFFGENSPFSQPRQRMLGSLGSGVIVDPAGVILTNYHVIKDASDIRVSTADGREYRTEVVLSDPDTDLTVLRIADPAGRLFPTIEFADSDDLAVGDLVLAIGNPFGVGQTVTSGIVSALARAGVGVSDFQFFIQTDAAINPGNSGGALIDMTGRLVGINTAIYSRSGGSNGIGFAIPANMARFVASAAESGGEIIRPWVGMTLQGVSSDIADSLGMQAPTGALVVIVTPDSPAARAGVSDGDVIVAFDGHPIEGEGAFGYRLSTKSVGETARLSVLRGGASVEFDLVLVEQPPRPPDEIVTISGQTRFAGASAATVSPHLIEQFGLAQDTVGVVVTAVAEGSPAAVLGLRPGDVLMSLNAVQLTTAADFQRVASSGAGRWQIIFRRGGRILRSSVPG